MPEYSYNSFELLRERMTEVDMLNLAKIIMKKPLMIQEEIEGQKYLFSHARTSHPLKQKQQQDYHLMGGLDSIWINAKQNVILLDCGAGFRSGALAGMCLETGERFFKIGVCEEQSYHS